MLALPTAISAESVSINIFVLSGSVSAKAANSLRVMRTAVMSKVLCGLVQLRATPVKSVVKTTVKSPTAGEIYKRGVVNSEAGP